MAKDYTVSEFKAVIRGRRHDGHVPAIEGESNVGKSNTGRKTKLSPDLQKRLLAAIAAGNYIHTACAAVGIGESTYFKWLERGRAGESPYREFMEALTRAEQEAVVSLVDLVRSHAVGDWRAAAFLLERRHKKDWGRHETIDATVTSQLDAELERRLLKGREANARGETR